MRILILFLVMVLAFFQALAQVDTIRIPTFNDPYSKMIRQLEKGNTALDYKVFRESFIDSEQFKVANGNKRKLDSLKKKMFGHVDMKEHAEVIKTARQIVSIDYTSLLGHRYLRHTYEILGDTANAGKYKRIQFGMLGSIVSNGDGKTCATGWPVIKVEEEYYILDLMGAEFKGQHHVNDKDGNCDKMDVIEEGKAKTYYFEISQIFKGYQKLGL